MQRPSPKVIRPIVLSVCIGGGGQCQRVALRLQVKHGDWEPGSLAHCQSIAVTLLTGRKKRERHQI